MPVTAPFPELSDECARRTRVSIRTIVSHYNAKLGRCYAKFVRTKFEFGNLVVFREVVDVVRGKIVAQINWIHATTNGTGATSSLCIVDMPSGERVNCNEIYEFDDLVEEQYGIK
jgi:hypothetical protein